MLNEYTVPLFSKFIRQHEVDMGDLALKDMSIEEKIATMESLWDDLCQHHHIESPSWHGDVLQQRDANRQQGNEEPINWEEAKQDILKKTR